jgi:hypothetical protein
MSDAPQAEKDRNRRVLSASFFIEGLFTCLLQAVWQPFVLGLGAPMSTLGLLESLGGPKMGVVTNFVQLVGGWLSDRRCRKPVIVLGTVAGVLCSRGQPGGCDRGVGRHRSCGEATACSRLGLGPLAIVRALADCPPQGVDTHVTQCHGAAHSEA